MKRKLFFTLTLSLFITIGVGSNAMAELQLQKISDSVYSYVGVPEGSPGNVFSANAGIVIGNDAVLVVDTLTSADEGKILLDKIKQITDKPIRYVVNTHYHLDHALGNNVFADQGAIIIGHSNCRKSLIKKEDHVTSDPVSFGLPKDFWATTRVTPPTITFDTNMTVDLGGISVALLYSGHTSHSAGSIIVHIQRSLGAFIVGMNIKIRYTGNTDSGYSQEN